MKQNLSKSSIIPFLEKNQLDINTQTKKKRNILHYIVSYTTHREDTSIEIERLILDKGVNASALDEYNRTVLHYALIKIDNEKDKFKNDPIEIISNLFNYAKIDANTKGI